jgi:DNA mismatch endonuclease (patch repair protein)
LQILIPTGPRRNFVCLHRLVSKVDAAGSSPVTRHPSLAVRPDFVFPKQRLAVFVDGCFWHGCPRHGTQPKGNAAFWRKKISGNQIRDKRVNRILRGAGWQVLRIWEHDLQNVERILKLISKILNRH